MVLKSLLYIESVVYCCTLVNSSDDRIQTKNRGYNSNRNRQGKKYNVDNVDGKYKIAAACNDLSSRGFLYTGPSLLSKLSLMVHLRLGRLSIDTVVMVQ